MTLVIKKHITYTLGILLIFSINSIAQNCGQVSGFTKSEVNNGNGTTNYTFYVETSAVSGGTKSVKITISCVSTTIVSNLCLSAPPAGTTHTLTYTNIPTCGSSPSIQWDGYTNSTCRGNSCAGSTISLPEELTSFQVENQNSSNLLNWTTASELNNQGFEVERSTDGENWENIGWVDGIGTTQEKQEYSYVDHDQLAGAVFYRLKQIDYDGNFEYSNVVVAPTAINDNYKVFPNPSNGNFTLNKIAESVSITNLAGTELYRSNVPINAISISDFESGVYILVLTNELGVKSTQRIIKY